MCFDAGLFSVLHFCFVPGSIARCLAFVVCLDLALGEYMVSIVVVLFCNRRAVVFSVSSNFFPNSVCVACGSIECLLCARDSVMFFARTSFKNEMFWP